MWSLRCFYWCLHTWIHEEIHSTSLGNYLLIQLPFSPQFSFSFLKLTVIKSDLVMSPMISASWAVLPPTDSRSCSFISCSPPSSTSWVFKTLLSGFVQDHKSDKCRTVAGGRGQRKNEMRDRKCLIQSSPVLHNLWIRKPQLKAQDQTSSLTIEQQLC